MIRYIIVVLIVLCSCKNESSNETAPEFLYKPNLTVKEFSQVNDYCSKLPLKDSSTFLNFKFGMTKERCDVILDSMFTDKKNITKIKSDYMPDSVKLFNLILDSDTLLYLIDPTFYNNRLCGLQVKIFMSQNVFKDLQDYHYKNYLLNVGKDTNNIARQDVHQYLYHPLKKSIQNYWLKIEDKLSPLMDAKYGNSQFIFQDSSEPFEDYHKVSYWFKPGRLLWFLSPSVNDFKSLSENYYKVKRNYVPPSNKEEAFDSWVYNLLFVIDWEDLKNYPLARNKADQEIKIYENKITEEENAKAAKEWNDKRKADSSKASKVGF